MAERAARTGSDRPPVAESLAAVGEQVRGLAGVDGSQERERALGALLFSLARVAGELDIDAEGALRRACDRFARRYAAMERAARARGLDPEALSSAEQAELWLEVKNET
jgi:uncharacterized protein YabN with tetrapyrrole methylase and pyrophosphatase domain